MAVGYCFSQVATNASMRSWTASTSCWPGARGELLGGPTQLRTPHGDRTGGGPDGGGAVAVAVPGPYEQGVLTVSGGSGALVAGPAQERLDLGFHSGLDDHAGAEAGDILQDLDQVAAPGEQGVDFGAQGMRRRYSCRHGRRAPSRVADV